MSSFLPAALAILGLCMFALSLWFQEGSAEAASRVPPPPPAAEEVQEVAPEEPLETGPVALEWSR